MSEIILNGMCIVIVCIMAIIMFKDMRGKK